MNKHDDYVYTIAPTTHKPPGYYTITKHDTQHPEYPEKYMVTLVDGKAPFCDCLGFMRQTYAKEDHKHIKLAARWVADGCPEHAQYKLMSIPKSKLHKITRIKDIF